MTLATRNHFIRIATLTVLVFVLLTLAAFILILVRNEDIPALPQARTIGFLSDFILTPYSPMAAIAAITLFPLLSFTGLIYILFAFEKTQTTEITFFAACVFIVALEGVRILIPVYSGWMTAGFYISAISRVVLFCRLFTTLCLLSSIIFTTGQTSQQIGPSIFLMAFFSFSLVNVVPFNSANLSTSFFIIPGYSQMIFLFMGVLGLLSSVSYLVQGKLRNAKEYTRAAGGILLILIGYSLLSFCDSWLFFASGTILLIQGTWLYLKQIHRYYLWQ